MPAGSTRHIEPLLPSGAVDWIGQSGDARRRTAPPPFLLTRPRRRQLLEPVPPQAPTYQLKAPAKTQEPPVVVPYGRRPGRIVQVRGEGLVDLPYPDQPHRRVAKLPVPRPRRPSNLFVPPQAAAVVDRSVVDVDRNRRRPLPTRPNRRIESSLVLTADQSVVDVDRNRRLPRLLRARRPTQFAPVPAQVVAAVASVPDVARRRRPLPPKPTNRPTHLFVPQAQGAHQPLPVVKPYGRRPGRIVVARGDGIYNVAAPPPFTGQSVPRIIVVGDQTEQWRKHYPTYLPIIFRSWLVPNTAAPNPELPHRRVVRPAVMRPRRPTNFSPVPPQQQNVVAPFLPDVNRHRPVRPGPMRPRRPTNHSPVPDQVVVTNPFLPDVSHRRVQRPGPMRPRRPTNFSPVPAANPFLPDLPRRRAQRPHPPRRDRTHVEVLTGAPDVPLQPRTACRRLIVPVRRRTPLSPIPPQVVVTAPPLVHAARTTLRHAIRPRRRARAGVPVLAAAAVDTTSYFHFFGGP